LDPFLYYSSHHIICTQNYPPEVRNLQNKPKSAHDPSETMAEPSSAPCIFFQKVSRRRRVRRFSRPTTAPRALRRPDVRGCLCVRVLLHVFFPPHLPCVHPNRGAATPGGRADSRTTPLCSARSCRRRRANFSRRAAAPRATPAPTVRRRPQSPPTRACRPCPVRRWPPRASRCRARIPRFPRICSCPVLVPLVRPGLIFVCARASGRTCPGQEG
jgi:hypothetical protein